MEFKMSSEVNSNNIVITTHEKVLDGSNADAFLSTALKITKTNTGNVIINLENTPDVDSAGVSKLMRLKTCIGVYGKSLVICNIGSDKSKDNDNAWIFKDILEIHKDLESALTA